MPELSTAYLITSGGLLDKDTVVLVAHRDATTDATGQGASGDLARIYLFKRDRSRWYVAGIPGEDFDGKSHIVGAIGRDPQTGLVIDAAGRVLSVSVESRPQAEERIPDEVMPAVVNARRIGGRCYAVSFERVAVVREAPGRWCGISQPIMDDDGAGVDFLRQGFNDIHGFAEDDLYACGGLGDLWHFDGQRWRWCDPPCNWRMERLCCAEDGQVYVVGFDGEVLVGRGSRWRLVIGEPQRFNVEQIAWFQGRLYAVTLNFLWVLDGAGWRGVEYGGDWRPGSFAFLDANADVLLLAGPYDVALFDGHAWTPLLGGVATTDLLRVQLLAQQVEHLEALRDALAWAADEAGGD